jgi:AraC-like DNA-binding protein
VFQNFSLNWFDLLAGLVVFQYVFIAVYLVSRRKRTLLASFFFLVGLNLIDGELMMHGFYYRYPNLALLEDSFVFTYGPILYFYTLGRKMTLKDIFHFVPAMVAFLLIIIFYTAQDYERKKIILDSIVHQQFPITIALLSSSFVFAHFFAYVFASASRLKTIVAAFVISWLSTFFSILQLRMIADAGMVIVVIILLYYIITLMTQNLSVTDQRPSLEQKDINDIRLKLDSLMVTEKIFTDANLTLESLAKKLNVSSRTLSQYLNEALNKSFFDYVNGLRIDEAKAILQNSDDPKLTVQEVMYKVGFNSKSSFNTLFREKTGKTPSSFRKMRSDS